MVTMTAQLGAAAATVTNGRPTRVAYDELADEDLMARLSSGDAAALEALYDRYGDLVYSTASRVLTDAHLAEDVSQEVFLCLWRQPEKYAAEKGRFVTWLVSVTRNRAVDEVRKRRRRFRHETASPVEKALGAPSGDGHDVALSAELADQRRALRAAMTALSPPQHEVIELAYFGGLTQREVARRLGQPLGTVKTRIRLGMLKLRQALRAANEASGRILEGGGDCRETVLEEVRPGAGVVRLARLP